MRVLELVVDAKLLTERAQECPPSTLVRDDLAQPAMEVLALSRRVCSREPIVNYLGPDVSESPRENLEKFQTDSIIEILEEIGDAVAPRGREDTVSKVQSLRLREASKGMVERTVLDRALFRTAGISRPYDSLDDESSGGSPDFTEIVQEFASGPIHLKEGPRSSMTGPFGWRFTPTAPYSTDSSCSTTWEILARTRKNRRSILVPSIDDACRSRLPHPSKR
jgi:hypothetical protein